MVPGSSLFRLPSLVRCPPRFAATALSLGAAPRNSPSCRPVSSALLSARVALRKRLGQHLLKNPDVVANIVRCAHLQPTDAVFEIGPGTGLLTLPLLAAARVVYAAEIDPALAREVTARAASAGLGGKLQLVVRDFLTIPLPQFDVLVANIPYQISSPVVRVILAHRPLPRLAVVMFQAEFAERMVARPGGKDYCRLSVNCALLCSSVRIEIRVGRAQFRPPPKVDSAVVAFVPREPPADLSLGGGYAGWDAFLRVVFGSKNKTLRASLGNKHVVGMLVGWRAGGAVRPPPPAVGAEPVEEGGGEEEDDAPALLDGDGDTSVAALSSAVRTAYGTVPRPALAATRAEVVHLLGRLGLHNHRPNGMSLDDFLRLYRALFAEGFRFAPEGGAAPPTPPV